MMMMEAMSVGEEDLPLGRQGGFPLGRQGGSPIIRGRSKTKAQDCRASPPGRNRLPHGDARLDKAFVKEEGKEYDNDDDEAMAEVDALQALNTALCFLVSINADATCVEEFLLAHPGALLLEGTGHLSEESASHILASQMQSCQCFSPLCQSNRRAVQALLDKGFEHYSARRLLFLPDDALPQSARLRFPQTTRSGAGVGGGGVREAPWKRAEFDWGGRTSPSPSSSRMSGWESTAYGHRMRALERSVRVARRTELRLRHDVLDAALQVRELDAERRRCRRGAAAPEAQRRDTTYNVDSGQQASAGTLTSKSIWTLCSQRPASHLRGASTTSHESADPLEFRARVSAIEYELRMAQLRLSGLEREHAERLREIRSARRFQFGILKRSFEDCRRHVCLTAVANAASAAAIT